MKINSTKSKNGRIAAFVVSLFAPLLIVAMAVAGIGLKGNLFGVRAEDKYHLVLDNTNAVSAAGDVTQYTKAGSEKIFTYTNVAAPTSGNHTHLNTGGTILTKTTSYLLLNLQLFFLVQAHYKLVFHMIHKNGMPIPQLFLVFQ